MKAVPAESATAQGQLLDASLRWTRRLPVDLSAVDACRRQAIVLNHQRYAAHVPVYRQLAEDLDLVEVDEADVIVRELMLTHEVFKSYRPEWLAEGDFRSLTAWLATLFAHPLELGTAKVEDLRSWCDHLRGSGVFVSYSSGSSGRLSFVPRDVRTWNALCGNGAYYTPTVFDERPVTYKDFDCLVLGFRGTGTGIQGAGTGLARIAARSHFLFDVELDADLLRLLGSGPRNDGEAALLERFEEATGRHRDEAYARSLDFLRRARDAGRPVLLFGTPGQVAEACRRALAEKDSFTLSPRSIAVSGGGWKSFDGEKLRRAELLELIEQAFGLPESHTIDTYSTSEINSVLMSCPAGRYHIPPLLEAVLLDDLLEPITSDDATGTLGFLDPFAFSYPGFVITGDQARMVRDGCPCGLAGPALVGEIERLPQHEVKGCGGIMASAVA